MSTQGEKRKFCANIKTLREKQKLTLRNLSRRSGVPLEMLEELEQGRLPAEMDVGDAFRLAEAFGCKVSELFK